MHINGNEVGRQIGKKRLSGIAQTAQGGFQSVFVTGMCDGGAFGVGDGAAQRAFGNSIFQSREIPAGRGRDGHGAGRRQLIPRQ